MAPLALWLVSCGCQPVTDPKTIMFRTYQGTAHNIGRKNPAAARAGKFLQPPAEVNFLGRKELIAEASDFPERGRLAKDERAGHPMKTAADPVPQPQDSARA